ncbi:MAG: hypothetical protein QXN15_09820 [Candidatus Jordarchaeales archaeon]
MTPRLIEGVINQAEYTMLKEKLPDATFVNASKVMNEAVVIKEPAEIERMRKAASIADEGIKAALRALRVGVTEAASLERERR